MGSEMCIRDSSWVGTIEDGVVVEGFGEGGGVVVVAGCRVHEGESKVVDMVGEASLEDSLDAGGGLVSTAEGSR